MTELKPCPRCARIPQLEGRGGLFGMEKWWIECVCGIRTRATSRECTAVKLWNGDKETIALKPCPFCGHDDPYKVSVVKVNRWMYAVHCNVCDMLGPGAEDKENAARRWNTRRRGKNGEEM